MRNTRIAYFILFLIVFNSCNIFGQKTIKSFFEEKDNSKIRIKKNLDSFKNKFNFLGYQNIYFNPEMTSITDSVIGGTVNVIFEDTVSNFFYLYFSETKEFHLLIPEICAIEHDNIDNINEINIYNLNGEMKYSFFNHHSDIQNYILESFIKDKDSIIVKSIRFNSKILLNPQNKNYRYIFRKKTIGEMTIDEYCSLIAKFKNEFNINSNIIVSKKNEESILWYRFYKIRPN